MRMAATAMPDSEKGDVMPAIRPPAVAGLFYPGDAGDLRYQVQKLLNDARPFKLSPDGNGDAQNRHARPPLPNPASRPTAGFAQPADSCGGKHAFRNSVFVPEGEDNPSPQSSPGGRGGEREKQLPIPESLREFNIKALIVPHAGYIYSGAIAATAYATLRPVAARIRRVILLGPTHRVAVRGLALPDADAFDTPLGRVMLDADAARVIGRLPQVCVSSQAHAQEHSLEVQLPFLQSVLTDFTLLPLAVGRATAEEVAEVLEFLWGGEETLIVISSDLSHYLPYPIAQRVDDETAQTILALEPPISHERACGGTPVNGLMLAAQKHALVPHLLDLRNSGDTAGTRDRVVGYASFAFTEEKSHVH